MGVLNVQRCKKPLCNDVDNIDLIIDYLNLLVKNLPEISPPQYTDKLEEID